MTFSWFKEVEKKKKRPHCSSIFSRMTIQEAGERIKELKKKGLTNKGICSEMRIGMQTLYKILRAVGMTSDTFWKQKVEPPSSAIEERVSVLEMQLEIVINKLKEIYEGNTKN